LPGRVVWHTLAGFAKPRPARGVYTLSWRYRHVPPPLDPPQ